MCASSYIISRLLILFASKCPYWIMYTLFSSDKPLTYILLKSFYYTTHAAIHLAS